MPQIFALPAADRRRDRPAVVALHCSGSSGREWRALSDSLGDRFTVIAPDLIGSAPGERWHGERPFRLADEAALVIDIIDSSGTPVHLVGHSYGGAVALRVAVARPHRIASLTLYEPSAFHVLRAIGEEGRDALAEIRRVAASVDRAVVAGAYVAGARRFVDYWSVPGAYDALKPAAQAEIVRFMPKACLDFRALVGERTPLSAYRRLGVPALILRGDRTPAPAALVAQTLAAVLRRCAVETLAGAGHMGPVTHPQAVARAMADHIRRAQAVVPATAKPLRPAA